MLKDERDDLMQDDESLDDMIHQYNEESELRRKINEMKKQKEASVPKEDDEETGFYIPPKETKDFTENENEEPLDEDKTLVIMDSQAKASFCTQSEDTLQDALEENVEVEEETKHAKAKKAKKRSAAEEEERAKKLNKIITIVIISILSIVLVAGVGYGIYSVFFNNDDEDIEEVVPEDKEDHKDKDTNQQNSTPQEDITDNSAEISRLEKQYQVYEDQIKSIENQINEKVAEIQNLQQAANNAKPFYESMKGYASEMEEAKLLMDSISDKESKEYKDAEKQYTTAKKQHEIVKQQFEEAGGSIDNTDKINILQANITELNTKIQGIQLEMSKIETDLYNLKK